MKKVICLLITAVLMLGLIPAGVTAAIEEYPVWVGGVQLNSDYMSDTGWSYEKTEYGGTLTLSNADITGFHSGGKANIYVAGDNNFELVIELVGENRLSGTNYGIYIDSPNGGLIITGEGSLDAQGAIRADVGDVQGFFISETTVKATSMCDDESALMSDLLRITDSTVEASGKAPGSCGIACKELSIEESFVTAAGYDQAGIYCTDRGGVTGNCKVTAETERGLSAIEIVAGKSEWGSDCEILAPRGCRFDEVDSYCGIYDSNNNPVKSVTIGKAYPLWVGTEQVTTANMRDLTVIEGVDAAEGGSAGFDPKNNTLILNNATIIGTHVINDMARCISFKGMDLSVQLSGENTIGDSRNHNAISCDGDITFSGSGSTNLLSLSAAIAFQDHSMTVDIDGDITISGETTAIYGRGHGKGILTVEGGTLTCTGEDYDGIMVDNLSVTGGKVVAETHNENLMVGADYTSAIIVLNKVTLGEGIYVTEPENGEFKLLPAMDAEDSESVYFATDGENRVSRAVIEPAGKITFRDDDGTELQSGILDINSTPVYKGEEPEKKSDAQYTYKFAGWDPELSAVTGDAVYTAKYDKVTNEYTVTFLDEDGTELQSGKVAYGTTPEYKGEEPQKKGDAQYSYKFAGWDREPAAVTGETSYTAKYDKITNEYTVKFLNDDGTVLQSGKVAYGKTPTFNGDDPVKAGTGEYTYKFSGWTPELSAVTKDAEYTAVYTATAVGATEYTVKEGGNGTWKQGSGETYKITVNRSVDDDKCFDHFTEVSIDGKALAGGEYTAVRGSTVVTLNAGTLEKLSVGSHTVTVNFDDGKAETTVTVQAKDTVPADNTPKTGDTSRTGLWLGALLVSGAAATVLIVYGRKRKSRG